MGDCFDNPIHHHCRHCRPPELNRYTLKLFSVRFVFSCWQERFWRVPSLSIKQIFSSTKNDVLIPASQNFFVSFRSIFLTLFRTQRDREMPFRWLNDNLYNFLQPQMEKYHFRSVVFYTSYKILKYRLNTEKIVTFYYDSESRSTRMAIIYYCKL